MSNVQRREENPDAFLRAQGTAEPNCDDATTYTISQGQLFLGSDVFSTIPGEQLMLFAPGASTGTITQFFEIDEGVLFWNNADFADNTARFCEDADGQVQAVFQGELPADCSAVIIRVYAGKFFEPCFLYFG
jgi:hypothetical protein